MRFISPATSPGGRPTSPATSPGGPLTSPAISPGHLLTSPAMSSNILAMSLTIFFRIPSCRQRHRQAVTRHRLRHRQVISTSPATSPDIFAMSLTTFSCSPQPRHFVLQYRWRCRSCLCDVAGDVLESPEHRWRHRQPLSKVARGLAKVVMDPLCFFPN